jgi:periplasmic protein TonB
MSLVADTILPPRRERNWTLWGSAAAIILAAHFAVGIYVLFLREPDATGANSPEAIIIDLAPVEAPPVEQMIAPPIEQKPEPPKPEPPKPEPEEKVIPVPDPVPVPQPLADLPVLETPPLPPEVKPEVTLPEPVKPDLPKPQPKKEVVKKLTAPKPVPKHEAKPTAKPDNQEQSRQSAARPQAPTAPSSASTASQANWKSELVAHIRRFQHYPEAARSRGESGTAAVSFTIDGGGRVTSARLASSSGSPVLDQEAVATVQRASPMPAPPNGGAVTINVPLRYSLR